MLSVVDMDFSLLKLLWPTARIKMHYFLFPLSYLLSSLLSPLSLGYGDV